MKSVFISILMFIVVFTALKFNILSLFDNRIILYVSIVCLIIVIGCALYFIGIPGSTDAKKVTTETQEKKDDETSV